MNPADRPWFLHRQENEGREMENKTQAGTCLLQGWGTCKPPGAGSSCWLRVSPVLTESPEQAAQQHGSAAVSPPRASQGCSEAGC